MKLNESILIILLRNKNGLSLQKNTPVIYPQSAVIPFRFQHGNLEVLLITARSGKRWIIPKGIIEDGLSPEQSAEQEAFEEAGIRGTVFPNSIGEYRYHKWGGTCTVQVYVIKVEEVLLEWPEAQVRERRWVGLEEAKKLVEENALKNMFQELTAFLSKN